MAAVLASLAISACSSTSAIQIAGAAMNAALETAGLKTPSSPTALRSQPITITTAADANTTDEGEPLSVVVRIYQLRSNSAFDNLGYAQVGNPDAEKALFGDALASAREITLLPGRTYQIDEQVTGDVTHIGIAALLRKPASQRWRLAVERRGKERSGLVIGVHACGLVAIDDKGKTTGAAECATSTALQGI